MTASTAEPVARASVPVKLLLILLAGPGYDVYVSNCARCHRQAGQGGIGPQLAGQVTTDFPDAKDEIALVRGGRDGMPSFAGDLSPAEIEDVVAYTRTELKK